MERGALKGHGALLLANVIWGLNSPICKTVLLSPENPEGLNHFALTVYRLVGAFLLFWLASAFLPRERVAWRDLGGLFIASLFGIQLDQILFLWGLSLTSPINVSIIATTVPILTMILAMFFLREPITLSRFYPNNLLQSRSELSECNTDGLVQPYEIGRAHV